MLQRMPEFNGQHSVFGYKLRSSVVNGCVDFLFYFFYSKIELVEKGARGVPGMSTVSIQTINTENDLEEFTVAGSIRLS